MNKKIVSCPCGKKLKVPLDAKKFNCVYCGREHEYIETIVDDVELIENKGDDIIGD